MKEFFKEAQMFTENQELLSVLEDIRTTLNKPKKMYVGKKKRKGGKGRMKKKQAKNFFKEIERLDKKLKKKSKRLKKTKHSPKLQYDPWSEAIAKSIPIVISKSLDKWASQGK